MRVVHTGPAAKKNLMAAAVVAKQKAVVKDKTLSDNVDLIPSALPTKLAIIDETVKVFLNG